MKKKYISCDAFRMPFGQLVPGSFTNRKDFPAAGGGGPIGPVQGRIMASILNFTACSEKQRTSMRRLVIWFLAVPFGAYFLIAAALGWFANEERLKQEYRHAQTASLAGALPPEGQSVLTYTAPAESSGPVEVALQVQVATRRVFAAERKLGSIRFGEMLVFPLFAPEAPAFETNLYGAVTVAPEQREVFLDWVGAQARLTGEAGPNGPVLVLRGLSGTPPIARQAREALEAQGFNLSPNFVYIQPFLKGREAALAGQGSLSLLSAVLLYLPSVFVVLLGLSGLLLRRKFRGAFSEQQEDEEEFCPQEAQAAPAATGPTDFIRALSERQTGQGPVRPRQVSKPGRDVPAKAKAARPARPRRSFLSVFLKLSLVAVAGILALILYPGGPEWTLALLAELTGSLGNETVSDAIAAAQGSAAVAWVPEHVTPVVMTAWAATAGFVSALAERVPFLQSVAFDDLYTEVVYNLKSLDLTSRKTFSGLPLLIVAAVLGMAIVLMRAMLKQRPTRSFSDRIPDPNERLQQKQRDSLMHKG
jgi:hypothetical protein